MIGPWTPERDAILIREWNNGISAENIAHSMRLGKNAVIGRVRRLRESGVDMRNRHPVKPRVAAAKKVTESFWTNERTEALVRLWNDYQSQSQIAMVLGCTRGAISSKLDRLRVNGVDLRWGNCAPAKTVQPRQTKPTGFKFSILPSSQLSAAAAKGKCIIEAIEARATGVGVPLDDLKRSQCRYPTGGSAPQWLFCGNPTDGGSWCPHCRTRVYQRGSVERAA